MMGKIYRVYNDHSLWKAYRLILTQAVKLFPIIGRLLVETTVYPDKIVDNLRGPFKRLGKWEYKRVDPDLNY